MSIAPRVLVVDLDGTLVRSDMLFETFWIALSNTWTTPLAALLSLPKGRAALKRRLCATAALDAAQLPYNHEVVAYIENWRASGGRTAVVTASDQKLADAVAAHLGLFDEAHGSDGHRNLKGKTKAEFLVDRFGERGFTYVGDAPADLAVFARAGNAITVNASPRLRAKVDALAERAEHLTASGGGIKPYIAALRPHQWLKNTLVFVPMLAAHTFSPEVIWRSTLAFIAFCLVASCVYLLNDLLDLAADRAHPRKRLRPLASGDLSLAHGTWMAPALLVLGLACAAPLGWKFLLVIIGYFIATCAYSLDLKRRPIIDICVLAGLYAMRVVAGGVATAIPLSVWLLAFSIFFFFSLAATKRCAELIDGLASGKIKARGRGYHSDDLPLVGTMMLASGYVSVLIMALYLNSPAVTKLYSSPSALWGICLVLLYWTSRTALVTHRGDMHDDPVVFALKDPTSQICLLLVAGFAVAGAIL